LQDGQPINNCDRLLIEKLKAKLPHPTFSADSTRILIQLALAAPNNRSLDLNIIPVPKA